MRCPATQRHKPQRAFALMRAAVTVKTLAALAALAALTTLGGCASRSTEIAPRPTDPATYAAWPCERLFDETDAVQRQAADVAYAVDSRAGNNLIALGLGATVFWPALLAMRPNGPEAEQLADLKGRFEALRVSAQTRNCGVAPDTLAADRQARLPVALGERLVYDDRSGATAHTLALQLSALRRDQIEFRIQLDGQWQDRPWRQDLAGNSLFDGPPALLGWRHFLKPDLALGQVLSGELAQAGESVPSGRLRGQVVATGPQVVAGRTFDVAVIELFGEAPGVSQLASGDGAPSTRLDGVLAVDRQHGLLLRLDLRSANPAFSVRRRLMRIEPSGS